MIAEQAPAAAPPSPPSFLEQIAHDLLAWERAEGLEVLQVWLNGWGVWIIDWRKPAGKGSRDSYEYGRAHGTDMDDRYRRLVADLIDAGNLAGLQVTHVAKPLEPAGTLLVWGADAAGRLQHRKMTISTKED